MKDIESKAPVIYETSLNQIIKNNSNLRCLTNEEVQKIKEVLESIEIIEKDFKKEHIHNIHQNITEKQSKERNLICPRCNSELKLRNGEYGKFYGCSSYPKCKFTMKY